MTKYNIKRVLKYEKIHRLLEKIRQFFFGLHYVYTFTSVVGLFYWKSII